MPAAPSLRYIEAPRRRGWFTRFYAAIAVTRAGRWISRHVFWKLDPVLLRISRGRLASTLVFPTAMLESRGAKTGTLRRHPVIYFHDGDRVIIIASHAGSPRHPAWYFNLRAHPDVSLGGDPMVALEVLDDTDRERLWSLADRVFPPYSRYRRDAAQAGRAIPIIELRHRADDARPRTPPPDAPLSTPPT